MTCTRASIDRTSIMSAVVRAGYGATSSGADSRFGPPAMSLAWRLERFREESRRPDSNRALHRRSSARERMARSTPPIRPNQRHHEQAPRSDRLRAIDERGVDRAQAVAVGRVCGDIADPVLFPTRPDDRPQVQAEIEITTNAENNRLTAIAWIGIRGPVWVE